MSDDSNTTDVMKLIGQVTNNNMVGKGEARQRYERMIGYYVATHTPGQYRFLAGPYPKRSDAQSVLKRYAQQAIVENPDCLFNSFEICRVYSARLPIGEHTQ